jgi:hypothetical protein
MHSEITPSSATEITDIPFSSPMIVAIPKGVLMKAVSMF